jgi:hypothetical protein
LDIFPVRGNHDALFAWNREIELTKRYPKWKMPSLYYKKEIDVGNGKKLGMLFIDSPLLLCSDYSYENDKTFTMNSNPDHIKRLRDVTCQEDPNML